MGVELRSFTMSCLVPKFIGALYSFCLKKVIKDVEGGLRSFISSGTELKQSTAKVKRKHICAPKEE